jgi:hypothetical protein
MRATLKELQTMGNVNNIVKEIPNGHNIQAFKDQQKIATDILEKDNNQVKFNVSDMLLANKENDLSKVFDETILLKRLNESSGIVCEDNGEFVTDGIFPKPFMLDKDKYCVIDYVKRYHKVDMFINVYTLPDSVAEFFSYWNKHKRTKKLLRNAECYLSLLSSGAYRDGKCKTIRATIADISSQVFTQDMSGNKQIDMDEQKGNATIEGATTTVHSVNYTTESMVEIQNIRELFIASDQYKQLCEAIPLLVDKMGLVKELSLCISVRRLRTFSFSSSSAPQLQAIVDFPTYGSEYYISSPLLVKKRGNDWNNNTFKRYSINTNIIYKHLNNALVPFSPISQLWYKTISIKDIEQVRFQTLKELEKSKEIQQYNLFNIQTMSNYDKGIIDRVLFKDSTEHSIFDSELYKYILSQKEQGTLPSALTSQIDDIAEVKLSILKTYKIKYRVVFVNAGYTVEGVNQYNVFLFDVGGAGRIADNLRFDVLNGGDGAEVVKYYRYDDTDMPEVLSLPLSVLSNLEGEDRFVKDLGVRMDKANFALVYEIEEE